ncbi:Microtubule-associated protein RP/EB like protein [Aduncisulcus paluster]|uniref:Microtubule-associated protein RP/EB like protein n=1 Tax=Aduncisulcus paluster TaxID=2918883 RepID=A0ABQ5KMJ2_9EUKA|nr:Microtubule-associated protein RP/EB like protein [Aduncisulcus paluster]|eukprot:gnl/Carplike_NY0171/10903_a15471_115.p1 GENE.gnl/Carplike_NY0171/10903_a15471_115~~gnl/Carplike_NY0171/10903_a15471_115.p1  ORF type:complete len:237 (+),score=35.11 gnl/Carplike_NY0171/10903_a15471_115:3-713(+)
MSSAYFIGKKQILDWVNDILKSHYKTIQDLSSGSAFLQILHIMYPKIVNISRVHFEATSVYEKEKNFKLLQYCLDKIGAKIFVDVKNLIKGKPMHTLELSQQFFSKFAGQLKSSEGVAEDPILVRRKAMEQHRKRSMGTSYQRGALSQSISRSGSLESAAEIAALKDKLVETERVAKAVEREKDFYFGKLRQVEILCQNLEDISSDVSSEVMDFAARIKSILYLTYEESIKEDSKF